MVLTNLAKAIATALFFDRVGYMIPKRDRLACTLFQPVPLQSQRPVCSLGPHRTL
jgi:hypothetical protein